MKSSEETLRKRGMAFEEERRLCEGATQSTLLDLVRHGTPSQKSAACECIDINDKDAAKLILDHLCQEQHLYTRIALCECLERGNQECAQEMCEYLGKIGSNQHKVLPEKVSLKKSYPLPRDLIARSLGKMEPSIFPVLLRELDRDLCEVRELIDAIGFMVFYNQELVSDDVAQRLIKLLKDTTDDVLMWKILLCFSAFPLPQVHKILQDYAKQDGVIALEAMRSLRILKQRS